MTVNWKLGITPVSELTLENFKDFARDYAQYTYALCYKATSDEKLAISSSASALAAVICQESGKEGSEELMPEKAIKRVLLDVLTKQQIARMNDDKLTATMTVEDKIVDAIVDKAVNLANINMPRYARVFSGTKGTLVILGLVLVLMAAIVLIWVNPSACNRVAQITTGGATGDVSAAARPDTDMLVSVDFDDRMAQTVNSGAYPVLFSVEGPDSRAVTGVNVFDSAGTEQTAYPCGEYTYCFIASDSDVFQTVVSSESGQMSSYFIVPPMDDEAVYPDNSSYVVSHNETARIRLSSGDTLTAAPAKGTLEEVPGGYIYTPVGGSECIGLDAFSYTTADGTVYTVPVLVSNSSPRVDQTSLSASVLHTPSRAGMCAGSILSEDADGDELVFTLTGTEGCSAFISPDGSYVALIEPEYRLGEASFSFTVSDGIIVSDPYTVSITLENHLISVSEMTREFVCYSGEDGYYEFELPAVDDDGDVLTWSLVTEQSGGVTAQWGSEVIISDGRVVKYRINPVQNEAFVEALTFACSDGWLSGTLMTVICNNSANQAPASSGNNSGVVEAGSVDNILQVTLRDDCPFDRCVITSVNEVFGGSVKGEWGWEELKFMFTPDGTEANAFVRLTVADVLTGQTANITFDIQVM